MLCLFVGAFVVGGMIKTIRDASRKDYYEAECRNLMNENRNLRLTMDNNRKLLGDYDKINKYAKSEGFRGAVDFFYYLSDHDKRLSSWARFLKEVRRIRNDVAHNGVIYDIDKAFLRKLKECLEICRIHEGLLNGEIDYE